MTDLSHGTAPPVAAPLPPDTSPVLRALLHALPPVAESQRLADALQIFARHGLALDQTGNAQDQLGISRHRSFDRDIGERDILGEQINGSNQNGQQKQKTAEPE